MEGLDLQKCTMGRCGLRFHLRCVPRRFWRRSSTRRDGLTVSFSTTFACPAHFCSLCGMSGDALRMVRCFGCKLHAFHVTKCEPEGILELQGDDSGAVSQRILCPSCVVARPEQQLSISAYGYTDRAMAKAREATFLDGARRSKKREDLLASGRYTFGRIEELRILGGEFVSHNPPRVRTLGGEDGKPYYYFGAHDKGGGCDWVLRDVRNKLHTRIKIDHNGVVTMEYALMAPKPLTYINGEPLAVRSVHPLADGDTFTIGITSFSYRFDPSRDGVPAHCIAGEHFVPERAPQAPAAADAGPSPVALGPDVALFLAAAARVDAGIAAPRAEQTAPAPRPADRATGVAASSRAGPAGGGVAAAAAG
ncbi:MAG: hypothetical protein VX563_07625, partial [Planctomycetota bacterium]|nr:hypothetical protein [Planctomycetota bacterium]